MGIIIEIQNKFYLWLKGEIKKKNQFNKKDLKNKNKKNEDQNWNNKYK